MSDDKSNTGYSNTGGCNTSDCNTGHYNTGHYNTGHYNTGECNTGNYNTGDRNTGNYNTGDRNTGDRNTGNYNTGDRNTGYRNTGNYNTGSFNTKTPKGGYFFNKWCTFSEWGSSKKPACLYPELTVWVTTSDMTIKERKTNLTYRTTGGFLKKFTMKEAWAISMSEASEEDLELIRNLPNFDYEIFEEITGVDIKPKEKLDVTCEGKEVEIDGKTYILQLKG